MHMRKNRKRDFRNTSAAFTSVELLACITACALLVAVITPVLTTSRSQADRVACVSNLRHLERALRQFAMENYDYPPWRQFAPAGNYYEPGKHQLWFQYWWLREGIGSPKYLMDPGETRTGARIATNWDLAGNGNGAVSYVLGLDSTTFLPRSIVVADRHILDAGYGVCSSGIDRAAQLPTLPNLYVRWTAEVHGEVGNVALADGSVESVDSDGLRRVVSEVRDSNASVHILKADWF
jgi:prepilin-type processing-associated H-X9-DG protein